MQDDGQLKVIDTLAREATLLKILHTCNSISVG